jgi:phosphatidylserine/phosphatidylglycerophosphate/cardiolipin synthase-like enzyme
MRTGSGGMRTVRSAPAGSGRVAPKPAQGPWRGCGRTLAVALLLAWSGSGLSRAAVPATPAAAAGSAAFARSAATGAAPAVQLVETSPIETVLDHPDIPEAYEVWKAMIDGASHTLDFAEFYASSEPGSRLEPIISAVEAAAKRGVKVRYLADKGFYNTYPQVLDRLKANAGVELRLYDMKSFAGGVLHAKYFLVDADEAYFGSQNFDFRSLAHIQELGVRIRQAELVRSFRDVFETDWSLAGGADRSFRSPAPSGGYHYPVTTVAGADTLRVTPVFSPKGWLPDESMWDLPRLVEMINSARSTVRVQLLTYKMTGRNEYFDALETALRGAAARGVTVQVLVSDWCKRAGTIEGLQSLEPLPGIEVKLVTIPEWSGGFIPFARVIHAKYLVVDDDKAWVGTSNWEKDYFYASRNVGLIIQGRAVAARLNSFFLDGWNGPYATPVNACQSYTPPKIGG